MISDLVVPVVVSLLVIVILAVTWVLDRRHKDEERDDG